MDLAGPARGPVEVCTKRPLLLVNPEAASVQRRSPPPNLAVAEARPVRKEHPPAVSQQGMLSPRTKLTTEGPPGALTAQAQPRYSNEQPGEAEGPNLAHRTGGLRHALGFPRGSFREARHPGLPRTMPCSSEGRLRPGPAAPHAVPPKQPPASFSPNSTSSRRGSLRTQPRARRVCVTAA